MRSGRAVDGPSSRFILPDRGYPRTRGPRRLIPRRRYPILRGRHAVRRYHARRCPGWMPMVAHRPAAARCALPTSSAPRRRRWRRMSIRYARRCRSTRVATRRPARWRAIRIIKAISNATITVAATPITAWAYEAMRRAVTYRRSASRPIRGRGHARLPLIRSIAVRMSRFRAQRRRRTRWFAPARSGAWARIARRRRRRATPISWRSRRNCRRRR